jgi:cupin 2 domain-containing protein
MAQVRRGRLDDPSAAPVEGEHHGVVAEVGGVRIEQILSGRLPEPATFVGRDHEWVVVLDGSARLELGGRTHRLGPGEWVLIPAGEPHVLHETTPGTRWLAVHVPVGLPGGSPPPG